MSAGLHSRPDKLNHAETVLYEIDMLRFSKDRLLSANTAQSEADEWSYLEVFLLHYRNLIEFFGHSNPRLDDLSIKRPNDVWPSNLPDKGDLDSLSKPDLWNKYERIPQSISRYLHHCTQQREIKKKWDVAAMYEDLRQAIEKFETLLPEYKPATKPVRATVQSTPAIATLGPDAKSTASGIAGSITAKKNP